MSTRIHVLLGAAALAAGCVTPDLGTDDLPIVSGQRLDALGAFSCDFGLDLALTTEPIGATIERDRILLQREALAETWPDDPGMLQKHIPFTPTSPSAGFAGGRYLFQGRLQAAIYADLIKRRFVYPAGVQFLSRPEFSGAECRDWSVVTAWRFAPLETHTAMRTERFDTGRTTLVGEALLAARLAVEAPWALWILGDKLYGEGSITGSSWAYELTGSTTLSVKTWYVVELYRYGTEVGIRVNGAREAYTTVSGSLMVSTASPRIGANSIGTNAYAGYISEVEIYKGAAYT